MRGKGASPYDRSELHLSFDPRQYHRRYSHPKHYHRCKIKSRVCEKNICRARVLHIFFSYLWTRLSDGLVRPLGTERGLTWVICQLEPISERKQTNWPGKTFQVSHLPWLSITFQDQNTSQIAKLLVTCRIQDNPEWIPSLPFRICQCLRPGWIAK